MSQIDEYFREVQRLAQVCVATSAVPHEFAENSPSEHASTVAHCLKLRAEFLSESEERSLTGYLEIGLFAGRPLRARLAAFAFAFELQHAVDSISIDRQCERYDPGQLLFQGDPKLFGAIRRRENTDSQDFELIKADAVKDVSGSEIYGLGTGFGKLTHHLNPGIVNWSRSMFPAASLFIRLNPHFFSKEQPLQLLTEATLVPANPKWLPGFSLRTGMSEFAAYSLDEVSPKDSAAEFWDYQVKGIRRLEVRVDRREDDYLTMMIEELPRADEPNGLMIGRCIHLDTRDPAATPLDQVKVNHLDLAINVYKGATRLTRDGQSLKEGKVVDASCRTHLLRIEQVPFIALFDYCRMFLRSSVLLAKWLTDLRPA